MVQIQPKQLRRIKNRESWETNPKNANVAYAVAKEAIKKIVVDVSSVSESGSLSRLRSIMTDEDTPLYQRMEAAETILSYELAPGSAVNIPSEQIAAASYQFMQAVADNAETPQSIRFKALRSLASIENARARVSDTDALADRRVHLIELINGARRRYLIESGDWPTVCASSHRWQLEASDDIDVPRLVQALDSIGSSLDRAVTSPDTAARNAARRVALLSVTARNRPDDWRQA
jgi:hypothetical protein